MIHTNVPFQADYYWGDNHSFNETLFQEVRFGSAETRYYHLSITMQMFELSVGGYYDPPVAAAHRYKRWIDSRTTNPNFTYIDVRFATAYAESVVSYTLLAKTIFGSPTGLGLDKATARSFFQDAKFPDGFYRRTLPAGLVEIGAEIVIMQAASIGICPGRNIAGPDSYICDTDSPANDILYCKLYENFVNKVILKLYPNPTTPALVRALQMNLHYLWESLGLLDVPCPELHPYGKIQNEVFSVQSETPMMFGRD
jgi:unspecific peroxygenase